MLEKHLAPLAATGTSDVEPHAKMSARPRCLRHDLTVSIGDPERRLPTPEQRTYQYCILFQIAICFSYSCSLGMVLARRSRACTARHIAQPLAKRAIAHIYKQQVTG